MFHNISILIYNLFFFICLDEDLDSDFFAPPSVLLHTPVKNAGSIGWGTSSTASSLPSTPHRLQGNILLGIIKTRISSSILMSVDRMDVDTDAQHARKDGFSST